jgi:membrane protease YdiL (CAAX protease family)
MSIRRIGGNGFERRMTDRPPPTTLAPLAILIVLGLITQLGTLAYNSDQPFSTILAPTLIVFGAVTIPLAGLGLRLGPSLGLGAPLLTDLLGHRVGAARQLIHDVRLASGIGLTLGVFLLLLRFAAQPYLPPELPELGHRGAVGGLLVSTNAALVEEIWVRLGVMTIIAWLLVRLLRHAELRRSVAWASIGLSAFVFGLIHLPQLNATGAASLVGIGATMGGNFLVGVTCGWLYWRRSLIAAIAAHFAVDLVLHVFSVLVF